MAKNNAASTTGHCKCCYKTKFTYADICTVRQVFKDKMSHCSMNKKHTQQGWLGGWKQFQLSKLNCEYVIHAKMVLNLRLLANQAPPVRTCMVRLSEDTVVREGGRDQTLELQDFDTLDSEMQI